MSFKVPGKTNQSVEELLLDDDDADDYCSQVLESLNLTPQQTNESKSFIQPKKLLGVTSSLPQQKPHQSCSCKNNNSNSKSSLSIHKCNSADCNKKLHKLHRLNIPNVVNSDKHNQRKQKPTQKSVFINSISETVIHSEKPTSSSLISTYSSPQSTNYKLKLKEHKKHMKAIASVYEQYSKFRKKKQTLSQEQKEQNLEESQKNNEKQPTQEPLTTETDKNNVEGRSIKNLADRMNKFRQSFTFSAKSPKIYNKYLLKKRKLETEIIE